MSAVKFHEGGWITLLVTALLVLLALTIKRHYRRTNQMLKRLDDLAKLANIPAAAAGPHGRGEFDRKAKTAVLLVNGYNGLGLHTLMGVVRMFGGIYTNFVFISIGTVDAGNFKGADEIGRLQEHVDSEVNKYIALMQRLGYHAEGFTALGTDAVEKIVELAPRVVAKYPNAVFFGGQLVFPRDTLLTRILHNAMVFTVQQKFYYRGYPFLILPIRV